MTSYSPQTIADIRKRTGLGILEIKKALDASNGDVEDAIKWLAQRSASGVRDRGSRDAREGVVHAYVHQGSKVGCIVEVNCETDFVAKNEEFKSFVADICLQIVAGNPLCLKREDVSQVVKDRVYFDALENESIKNKPQHIKEKIANGKLEQFFKEGCLLEQPFVKDTSKTINELLVEIAAKFKENIVIRRFTRYQIGDTQ